MEWSPKRLMGVVVRSVNHVTITTGSLLSVVVSFTSSSIKKVLTMKPLQFGHRM